MSVSDNFSAFCSNLRMSKETVDNIAYRYKRITRQLNSDYWGTNSEVTHSLYVGSYGRDTEIHVSDIDMLFILPPAVYYQYDRYTGNGQSALLQAVRNSIQKTYSTSYIKADGQVICVDFTDGINFEIVPCFNNTDDSFTYPDTNDGGRWRVTDPRPEIRTISEYNRECNGNLKRLCRMARAWKDKWQVPMGGLLIDTLAYNFLRQWANRDKSFVYYDWMSRDFFKFLSEQDPDKSYWLAVGSNQHVYRRGPFEYKALRCYNIALEAIEKEQYETTAKSKWREIYGTKFPG